MIHTASALLAGAFLNLGLTRIAEFFDPLASAGIQCDSEVSMPCVYTEVPVELSVGA